MDVDAETEIEAKKKHIRARAQQSFDLHTRQADALIGLKRASELREQIAHDAFLIAIEHHAAISILMRFDHYASSFALLRPLIESTARGLWALHVATEDSLKKFASKRATNDLESLAKYLAKAPSLPELKVLANAIDFFSRIVNSFSHAGLEQLIRRESGFHESELLESLIVSDLFAALAGGGLAKIHGKDEFKKILEENIQRLVTESKRSPTTSDSYSSKEN